MIYDSKYSEQCWQNSCHSHPDMVNMDSYVFIICSYATAINDYRYMTVNYRQAIDHLITGTCLWCNAIYWVHVALYRQVFFAWCSINLSIMRLPCYFPHAASPHSLSLPRHPYSCHLFYLSLEWCLSPLTISRYLYQPMLSFHYLPSMPPISAHLVSSIYFSCNNSFYSKTSVIVIAI